MTDFGPEPGPDDPGAVAPPPIAPGPAPTTTSRKLIALITLLAVLLLALGGILSLFFKGTTKSSDAKSDASSSSGDTTTTAKARTTPTSAVPSLEALGATGAELEAAINAGRNAIYHATYAITAPQLDPNTKETLEVWRKTSKVRTDVTDVSPTGTKHSSATVSGATSVACDIIAGVPKCSKSSSGPIDLPESFAAEVAGATSPVTLTVSDVVIAGVNGRCYAAPGIGGLCVRADGALLAADLHGTRADLIAIDDAVPDDVFVPNLTGTTVPAPSSGSPSS